MELGSASAACASPSSSAIRGPLANKRVQKYQRKCFRVGSLKSQHYTTQRREKNRTSCTSEVTDGSTGDDDVARLREENEKLRALVVAALDNVSEESRESFFERHAQLRAQAEAAGEQLPEITSEGVLAIAHEAVQDAEAQPAAETPEAEQPALQESAPAEDTDKKGWQLSPEGDAAILHGDDDTVTFSFGALVDKIKNNLSPQAFRSNGSRSRVGSSAGLATRPGAAQLPRGSLSTAGKGSSIQRSRSRMQAVPKDKAEAESSRGSMSQSNTAIAEEPENGRVSFHTETSGEPETKEELVDSEYGGGQDTEPLRPSSTGLEEIAERGREQLEERQLPAETSGEPETKEELVDSEYGGGQDTEPLRPSSTGLEEIAERGKEQLEERQPPAETSGEPETKEELVDSEYGGGQDTEPLRPSSTGLEEIAERGKEQSEERQPPAETSGEPETKEELVDSEYGGGQDTEPLRPSSTGLEEIAQKGREQLADHNISAEPDSAAGETEELVDSEYGGGQDTEPLRPSTTGIEEVAKKGRQQRAGQDTPAELDSATGTKEEVLESEFGGGQDTEPLRPSTTGIGEVAKKGRHQRVGQETPAEPDSATGTKEDVLDSESGAGQDTEPLTPSSSGLRSVAEHGREEHKERRGAAVGNTASGSSEASQSASASAAELVKGREQWLYFVHPEQPVAGQRATIYFNNNVSDILREKVRRQVHVKFNNWELEDEGGAWFEMDKADAPHDEGADWWQVEVSVPEDAFEMNYIFTDGEGATDNNQGKNYMTAVTSSMTPEAWEEKAIDRQIAAEKKRKAEEREARAQQQQERRAAEDTEDRAAAQQRATELRNAVAYHREGAVSSLEREGKLTWFTEPKQPIPGQRVKLLYNAQSGSLAYMTPLPSPPTLVLGYNGWIDTQDIIMSEAKGVQPAGDWFAAEVDVPQDVAVLNFVVQYYEHYDNNYGVDFKAAVEVDSEGSSLDDFEARKAEEIYQSLQHRRQQQRDEWERRERRRAETRATAKAKAQEVLRRQMRHVLYTEPSAPQAGQEMTVYYNPSNTDLAGSSEVYITGGFNRWTHKKKFGPLKMTPPTGEGSHFSATVKVPRSAHAVDFVLSNVAEGEGVYDNRGGLDYHLPVEGSELEPPGLHVVHVAVEMAPICKVGGLGDVVTALGRAVQDEGHMVEVILPRYDFFLQSPLLGATQLEAEFDWGGTHIWVSTCVVQGLRCFFIEPANGFFAVDSVYGRSDDAKRFDFFNKAALEFLLQTGRQPDILHCHDWSTAILAETYWKEYHHYGLWRPKVVFTIHNAEYGLQRIGSAAYYSQRFTTVSPSYASEIGANPAIAAHSGKFMGIRNGIDLDIWDPENDNLLPMPYTASNVAEGKKAARETLRYRLGLTGWGDKPLVGVVTRLTEQKGLHLIKHAAWRTLERGGQFVLLGSAPDPKIQAQFNALAASLGGENAHFAFFYDESLSHLIYAGCDIIAVPSMFEPCGLTQLIAMRYGSVPVVRATGGLRDTVFDVECDKARAAWEMEGSSDYERDDLDATNGFSFEGTDESSLDYALNRALNAYYNDRTWFNSLAARIMRQDWSWNRPALDYVDLYWQAMK